MPFAVRLTDDAAGDMAEIIDHISGRHGTTEARYVIDHIEQALSSLSESPQRGADPKELLAVGVKEYGELFFKPYRIIYRVEEEDVFVLVIADGRRDSRTLLERRLLES